MFMMQPTQEKMDAWYKHVEKLGEGLLSNQVDSWRTGGKQTRPLTRYNGPAPGYRKECQAVKERNYPDFVLA